MQREWIKSTWHGYAAAIAFTAFAALLRWSLPGVLADTPFLAFYPAIIAAAILGGFGPGIVATVASTLFYAIWFGATPEGFRLASGTEWLRVAIFIAGGTGASFLAQWQRTAQADQRKSDERLRLVLGASELGWWYWDFITDLLDGDEKTKSLVDLPANEPIQFFHRILDRTHPDDQGFLQERAAELKARPGDYEAEYRVTWPDGSLHWLLAKGRSFDTAHGKPLHAMGIVMDITERKQAEEELKAARQSAERAKAAAEQASRAKDHFLAVLSHELRTPLTPVVMGVSMLQDRLDLEPKVQETLEMIRRNVEMEARLIDDLLDVTRITRGKIELNRSPVELCTVIHRAVEVCKPDIEARELHFGVDLGPSAPYWIEADVPRLQQVFWNLLKNAIKFTPHGGYVGIRCQPNEKHVVIEVNDSGIGIEPDALLRVFNAFEQAERSITRQFGGLGLGLTISKAMVELHGGTISAHSKGKDKGATFRVLLPMVAPVSQPETAAPSTPPRRVASPLRILLVEDHGVTAKIMQMMLSAEGHTVERAGDIATAIRMAENNAYDLLLSDLGLPDGSGHDLIQQLRQRGHRFPGVALSGYGLEEDIKRSHEAGFSAHLTKPASREAVVETIATVVSMNNLAITNNDQDMPSRQSLVFDSQVALRQCFSEQKMLDQMIECFLCDYDTLLPEIHSAVQRGDLSELGKLGHRVKNSMLYLGAQLASEAAANVERVGRYGGKPIEVEEAVRWLERECQVLQAALKEYQTNASASHE